VTTQLAPQTIYSDLLQEVGTYCFGVNPRKPNEFGLRMLKNRADVLTKANAAEGTEIQGFIAFLSGDSEKGAALVERAISLSPKKGPILIRYMQMCDHIGSFERVAELARKYRNLLVGTVSETREAMTMLAHNGFLGAADELHAELSKMNALSKEVTYVAGERLVSRCDHSMFSDEQTSAAVIFVRSYLLQRGYSARRIGISGITGEGERDSSLMYEFDITADSQMAAELEWDLFGELEAQQFPAEVSGKFLFSVGTYSGD